MTWLGLRSIAKAFGFRAARFRSNANGQIAVIFALASTAIVVGTGAGIDLSRAYLARQKLSQVAMLTCQYSVRPSVVDMASSTSGTASGFTTYINAVNTYATGSLANQRLSTSTAAATGPYTGPYFTATQASGANTAAGTAPTGAMTDISVNVPSTFLKIVNITQIPVHAHVNCQQAVNVAAPSPNDNPYLLNEGFETPCAYYCFTLPTGQTGTQSNPTNTFPATPSYTGDHGAQYYIMGYCLETDLSGVIGPAAQGSHTAELDCDNGSGTAGNSSITTKIYLPVGYYEMRYDYRSRVDDPMYDPTYICATTANDLAWANDNTFSGAVRTNQINAYLDMSVGGGPPPLHTTIDGTQQLAGSNLVDTCVYSTNWVTRSVKIKVTTPAYYWISFAADGGNDSYGGQIDALRVCVDTCPAIAGETLDNFPASWVAQSGVKLFEDSFESPAYVAAYGNYFATNGNLYNSKGSTNVSYCAYSLVSPPGWPCQSATGWATAPYNETVYWTQGAASGLGSQYISLQGSNAYTNSSDPINRSVSHSFILDPGYYSISYNYIGLMDFSYDFIYGTSCTYTPSGPYSNNAYGQKHGHDYGSQGVLYAQYLATDDLTVFMSNGQMVSTPILNSTLGSTTTYNNPDGTTTTSPKVAPDNGGNFTAYGSVNSVLDTCWYSSGYVWTPRSVNVKITKPGTYWLTFSALADPLTGTGGGPGIDDVKLTALGSPFMTTPPTSPLVAIPNPAPANDSNYTNNGAFNGFYIVADPFMPTAADQ